MRVSGARKKVTWVKIALSFQNLRVAALVSNVARRVIKVDNVQINPNDNRSVEPATTVMKKDILVEIVPSQEKHSKEPDPEVAISAIRKAILPEIAHNKIQQIQDQYRGRQALIGPQVIMMPGEQTIKMDLK